MKASLFLFLNLTLFFLLFFRGNSFIGLRVFEDSGLADPVHCLVRPDLSYLFCNLMVSFSFLFYLGFVEVSRLVICPVVVRAHETASLLCRLYHVSMLISCSCRLHCPWKVQDVARIQRVLGRVRNQSWVDRDIRTCQSVYRTNLAAVEDITAWLDDRVNLLARCQLNTRSAIGGLLEVYLA